MTQGLRIVAAGARTPLGVSLEASMAAVRAGISELSDHPFLVDRRFEPIRLSQDSLLDPSLMGPERLIEMASSVLNEVCSSLEPVVRSNGSIPVFLALPETRPGFARADAQAVREGVTRKQMLVELQLVESFEGGHAAGLLALESACSWILKGKAEVCVVVGVDSYLTVETLDWLDKNRQLATSYHRGAFFPGEGAGAVVIASASAVSRYQLEALATIGGLAASTETSVIKTNDLCLGHGLTECIRKATSQLSIPDEMIDGVVCDINGERYRSEEWGFAMLRFPHLFVDPTAYEAPASCWGDMGAASGPLFIGVAIVAGRNGWSKGVRYLIWTSSEGGQRMALLLLLEGDREGTSNGRRR